MVWGIVHGNEHENTPPSPGGIPRRIYDDKSKPSSNFYTYFLQFWLYLFIRTKQSAKKQGLLLLVFDMAKLLAYFRAKICINTPLPFPRIAILQNIYKIFLGIWHG